MIGLKRSFASLFLERPSHIGTDLSERLSRTGMYPREDLFLGLLIIPSQAVLAGAFIEVIKGIPEVVPVRREGRACPEIGTQAVIEGVGGGLSDGLLHSAGRVGR